MIRMTLNESGKLTQEQILEAIGKTDPLIKENIAYYDGENPTEAAQYRLKEIKGSKPNNYLESSYAATLVDCAIGYCGSEITYSDNVKDQKNASKMMEQLKPIFDYNNNDVLAMKVFTQQLYAGVCYKAHYVEKEDKINKYMMATLDPLCCWPIYDYSIGNKLLAFIYKEETGIKETQRLTVYYPYMTDRFIFNGSELKEETLNIPNDYAPNIPVAIYYNSFDKGKIVSLFQNVKTLINAKDCIIRGNWNEIDRGIQSILLHYAEIQAKDIEDMNERQNWQVGMEDLQNMKYLMKTIQWEYQKFFNDVITQEIHKAAHIVDFYNPETGIGSPASGKALRYRLTDMDSRCKMFEMFNREGEYQSLKLLQNIKAIPECELNTITIEYKHNIPEDFYEMLLAYNQDTLLSKKTKYEKLGIDPGIEQERKDEEDNDSLDGMIKKLSDKNKDNLNNQDNQDDITDQNNPQSEQVNNGD